ncbi:nuclease-related domain-containing protein [Nocardioides sp. GCM10030258]|uniref:nuclease-related domain-containing protein n=1 Tax=unclassified Nocardioides TaxID=2615069 RepID=UPI00360FE6DF
MTQETVVNRWKRYGKDRLYVSVPVEGGDDLKVGWWDLLSDEAHPENPAHAALLSSAVASWRQQNGGENSPVPSTRATSVEPSAPAEPLPVAAPASVLDATARPWRDLSENRAGAAAREQALSRRAAAPVKTTLARVLGVHTDERAWRIGAHGEELVATQLNKAAIRDPRWRFLHAIPVGNRGSDIDHLLIGPGGVFTVNAKNHPGAKIWVGGNTLMVNGAKTQHIRNARYEAQRASKFLTQACGFPVHVDGLVVTVNARDVVIKAQPEGVSVTWRKNVSTWLLNHGDVLSDEAISAIYEMARRSTTWTGAHP